MSTLTIKEWTGELRSGNRAQTTGTLHEVEDGQEKFCCLGVVQDMLHQRGLCERQPRLDGDGEVVGYGYVYTYKWNDESVERTAIETGTLTDQARNLLGFKHNNPAIELPWVNHEDRREGEEDRHESYTLAQLNDSGMPFNQIADLIDYFFGG